MKNLVAALCFLILLSAAGLLHAQEEPVDTALVSKMRDAEMSSSKVMNIASRLCDVFGPRLTGSPEFMAAAKWAEQELEKMGLTNVHLEAWGPFGRGWTLKRIEAAVTAPVYFPVTAYPKAWSPGLKKPVTGTPLLFDAKSDSDLARFRGRLKNAIVFLSEERELAPRFTPDARRMHDTVLLQLANAIPGVRRGFRGTRPRPGGDFLSRFMLAQKKLEMCASEGAAVVVEASNGDDGTLFVQGATPPGQPGAFLAGGRPVYSRLAPRTVPQIVFGAEEYNRICRMVKLGAQVRLDLALDVSFSDADSMGYNIIAEIPGTDLKDQAVMLGGHFDSWHAGTGATDDGAGVAVCMETVRLITSLGLKPRRTIRIALWGGEEQGLLGSRAYVAEHLAKMDTSVKSGSRFTELPDFNKLSAYFNLDNGTGKIRGVYLQGNEAVRTIFRSWLAPFRDMDAATLSSNNTGGTDHGSFDQVNIPAFQFIQDPIDYDTRTHHSNMDVYDRLQEEDLKQASLIMAAFVWNAANRNELLPRKSRPASRGGS